MSNKDIFGNGNNEEIFYSSIDSLQDSSTSDAYGLNAANKVNSLSSDPIIAETERLSTDNLDIIYSINSISGDIDNLVSSPFLINQTSIPNQLFRPQLTDFNKLNIDFVTGEDKNNPFVSTFDLFNSNLLKIEKDISLFPISTLMSVDSTPADKREFAIKTEGRLTINGDGNNLSDDAPIYAALGFNLPIKLNTDGTSQLDDSGRKILRDNSITVANSYTTNVGFNEQYAGSSSPQTIEEIIVDIPAYDSLKQEKLNSFIADNTQTITFDIGGRKNNIKNATSWSKNFPAPGTVDNPTVVEIIGGGLTIPNNVNLSNYVIIVQEGNIKFRGSKNNLDNVVLIANNGDINLAKVKASDLSVFASGSIDMNDAASFAGDSLIASDDSSGGITFRGATEDVDVNNNIRVVSSGDITFDGGADTRGIFESAGDFTSNSQSTIYGEIAAKGDIQFNNGVRVVATNVNSNTVAVQDNNNDFEDTDFFADEASDSTLANFSTFASLGSSIEVASAPLQFSQAENNLVIDGEEIFGELTNADKKQVGNSEKFIDEYPLTITTDSSLIKLEITFENSLYLEIFNNNTEQIVNDYFNYNSNYGSNEIVFVTSPNINYTVRVISNDEDNLGTYQLKASSPRLIVPGEEAISVTSPQGKNINDYYKLQNLEVGSLVKLNLYSSSQNSTYIELIDANTQDILIEETINSYGENNKDLAFIPASNTTYLLRIHTDNYTEATYILSIEDENLPNLSVNDKEINGIFSEDDIIYDSYFSINAVDYYKLSDLEADKPITIEVKALSDDLYTTIELINADTQESIGGEIGGDGYGFDFQQLTFFPEEDINYAFRAGGYKNRDENPLGEYTVKIKETPEILSEQNIEGQLNQEDFHNLTDSSSFVDNYLLSNFEKGQIVGLNLSSEDFNPSLRLINVDTQEVISFYGNQSLGSSSTNIDNFDNNAHIVFAPEADTNYMIWVSNNGSGQGNYNFSTKILDTVSVVDTVVPGILNTNDAYHPDKEGKIIDEYQLANLKSADTVKLKLESNNFNARLEVFDVTNRRTVVDTYNNYSDGFNSQAFFTPKDGTDYILRVTSENESEIGNYTLTTSTGKPDLEIISANINNNEDIVIINQPFTISWNGINQENMDGDMDAAFSWYDRVYLSEDQYFDSQDIYLGDASISSNKLPLKTGDTYSLSDTVSITKNIGKYPYLIFVADINNNLTEINEQNNYYTKQIEVKSPDLKIEAVEIPSTALIGDTIEIDWILENIGTADANGSWTDKIWISKDKVKSKEDTLLLAKKYDELISLNAGESLSSNATVQIPSKEVLNNEVEGNDSIKDANDISPNFILNGVDTYVAEIKGELPSAYQNDYFKIFASPGDEITVDALPREESNLNNTDLYLFNEKGYIISYGSRLDGRPQLTYTVQDSDYEGDYYIYISSLNSNIKYTLKTTLETPKLITSRLDDGNYYILLETDTENNFTESDESNNISYSTETIYLTSSLSKPDLEISATVYNKTTALIGEEIEVSWTVTNVSGDVQALADWSDYVYVSSNDAPLESETPLLIKSADEKTPLKPGESYTFTEKITLPNAIGKYNILLVTDPNNNQIETNEENNLFKIPIEVIAPDLKIKLLDTKNTAEFGETLEITWTTENTGKADAIAGTERIWLSIDEDINYNFDRDFLLRPINAADENYSSIAGESSIYRSAFVTLPLGVKWKEGNYYIFVETDIKNTSSESNEVNNVSTSKAIFLSLPLIPDLTVGDIEVSAKGKPQEDIFISWNIYNGGDAETSSTWDDEIYLIPEENYSANNYSLNDAISLGRLSHITTIPFGGKHEIKDYKITLPSNIADGDYRVIVVTDKGNNVYEGDKENNNQEVSAGKLTVGRVDLVPIITFINNTPTSDETFSATSGDKILLRWDVINNGTAATSGTWVDKIYLSNKSLERFSPNDSNLIKEIQHESGLNPQQRYSKDLDIDLPINISGEKYLYLITDASNNIREFNTTNNGEANTVYQKLQITLADYADLAVSNITVTESTIGNPATINVGWKVSNIGTGAGITD
ncbi:MAG: CARDB domain-containing protein, partial [Rivularia sp. (in: cyanobacteria)]